MEDGLFLVTGDNGQDQIVIRRDADAFSADNRLIRLGGYGTLKVGSGDDALVRDAGYDLVVEGPGADVSIFGIAQENGTRDVDGIRNFEATED